MVSLLGFISKLRKQRWFQVSLVMLLAGITAVVIYIRHEMKQLPDWWAPADPTRAAVIKQGESTENFVVTEMNRITGRPDGTEWSLRLTEADLNAWLATRLPRWAENQFPGSFIATGVAEAHLRLEDGVIRFGTLVDFSPPPDGILNSRNSQSLSMTFEPSVDADGQLHLTLTAATVGQLPVPAQTVVGRVLNHFKLPNQDLYDLVKGRAITPTINQGKRRRMILTSLAVEPGLLTLNWRTEVGQPRDRGDQSGGGG